MLAHSSDRLQSARMFGNVEFEYQTTCRNKSRAQSCADDFKSDGYKVRIVKSRSYDDQYHIYTRKA